MNETVVADPMAQANPASVFDLGLPCSTRYRLLKAMDPQDQYEACRQLLDIWRISNIKKLEKFFLWICVYDVVLNLHLKYDILELIITTTIVPPVGTVKFHRTEHAAANVLYLVQERAFDSDQYWVVLKKILHLYRTAFGLDKVDKVLRNLIAVGFRKQGLANPFGKIFPLVLEFKQCPFFVDLCAFIFDTCGAKLSVKNRLLLLQILYTDENRFMDPLVQLVHQCPQLNFRLEACDILYGNGSDEVKKKAKRWIKTLLPDGGDYVQNPENVHLDSVANSVDETLKILVEKNRKKTAPDNLYALLCHHFEKSEKIVASLTRIFQYDFLKFSSLNLTLGEVLAQIYLTIDGQPEAVRDQLMVRLGQELRDAYDTCSKGYVTRLVNVVSGFNLYGESSLGICTSIEDEIYHLYSTTVNGLVQNSPANVRDTLIQQLAVPPDQSAERRELIEFLRPNWSLIWTTIQNRFAGDVCPNQLDLHCRNAMAKYDGN
ncbi:hypothetical protein MIV061R [Invertebrate iridescent virus 3]|uniref:Uncharacterized protein 061R n=1 Tax=Invertebrate iridescent virus 3 TaxID=345201 RepID=VF467_IIV3|nr:hypothetical protein MIV061R [Invertebrate iridescent virus 3]Q196Z9.1 RecName: Full=Uncharacterized protein 061R [Invertebrate iridescent virus 3]ABF82091.1 hypothetical protein MIV061R [Invertebrate iridescent virus 3]